MPLSELLKLYDIDQSEIGVKEEDKKEDASEVEAFSTDDGVLKGFSPLLSIILRLHIKLVLVHGIKYLIRV